MGHLTDHTVALRTLRGLARVRSFTPAEDNLHNRSKPTKASVTSGPSNSQALTRLILLHPAARRRRLARPRVGYSVAPREARHLGRSEVLLEEMPVKAPRWVLRWEACSAECGGVDGRNRRNINRPAINSNNRTPLNKGMLTTTGRLEPACRAAVTRWNNADCRFADNFVLGG